MRREGWVRCRGMGGRCTCFPQHQQLCSSRSCFWWGVGADPAASPSHGGSPWHSQLELLWGLVPPPGEESTAGWGPCWAHLFPAAGGGTQQLEAVLPLTEIDLKRDKTPSQPDQQPALCWPKSKPYFFFPLRDSLMGSGML